MVEIEIEIVRTETIKPSSPTPDALKRFNLSIFDQFMVDIYIPFVLFYPAGSESSCSDRIGRLKQSLSEALVRFYPVAGRLVNAEHYVDCNDAGVDFAEARVKGCRLSDILGSPDHDKFLGKLFPAQSGARPQTLVSVQANALECGGIAIGACFSHKIMDACAMSAFLKGWAAAARGDTELPAPVSDTTASRFPPTPATLPRPQPVMCKSSRRRFVFQATNIAALRDKISRAGTETPTRVGAVSALIWKCVLNALTKKSGHETKPSVASQTMNLRRRVEPPLSENSLGNMVVPVFTESGVGDELQLLAGQLSQGLRDAARSYVTKLGDPEAGKTIVLEDAKKRVALFGREDVNYYLFTSWCKLGFYEPDFGWGRPAWFSQCISNPNMKNLVLLTDTRDGDGIEVLLSLPEEDMILFETDPELLEFGVLNPSVCPQIQG